jgi:hypothetical protein
VAVNDLLVHPRDNDLVLGTHGRGIWILDNVNALQELTPAVLASPAHLFTIEPARMIRITGEKAHAGDMIFRGENPPAGAIVDLWLGSDDPGDLRLEVLDDSGEWVADIPMRRPGRGVNRVVWNLRYSPFYAGPGKERAERSGSSGILVLPGEYTLRLTVGDTVSEQTVTVSEDPRLRVGAAERSAWTEKQLSLSALAREAGDLRRRIAEAGEAAEALRDTRRNRELKVEAADLDRMGRELETRIRRLAGEISGWTGEPTADQLSEEEYFRSMVPRLTERLEVLLERIG